jgi:DNA gyrase subunit A
MVNILAMGVEERVTAAVVIKDFKDAQYCTMATRKGKIKRVELSEFASVRPSGLIAIGLEADDFLGWVRLTSGDDDVIIVTEQGQSIRFHESQVRSMGRPAKGVKAARLRKNDFIAGMNVVVPGEDLLVVTEKGYGKRTPLEEYPNQNRAGLGVVTLSRKKRNVTGKVASARVVNEEDELTIISSGGIVLRTKVKQISQAGRATMGVRVIDLKKGETVAAVARLSAKVLEEAGAEE